VWDSLFDILAAALWDPVARRPRLGLLLWTVVVVLTFGSLVIYVATR
jgi:hypothetical protein